MTTAFGALRRGRADAAQYREQLGSLHRNTSPGSMDPLAPVRLEVIDRATTRLCKRLH